MKKKLAIIAATALLLTGCASVQMPNNTFQIDKTLDDGRTVTCVVLNGHGISCDWENAK